MDDYSIIAIVIAALAILIALRIRTRRPNKEALEVAVSTQPELLVDRFSSPTSQSPTQDSTEALLCLTRSELLEYNGENGKPIYVSFLVRVFLPFLILTRETFMMYHPPLNITVLENLGTRWQAMLLKWHWENKP